jgi:integrase
LAIASSSSENKKDHDRPRRWRYADPYAAISPPRQAFADEVGITKTSAYSCLCRRRHNYDLRHTFGTRMAAAGAPMRTLQEWMGHRDLATTQIYADYAPSAREAEMIAAAFSRGSNRGSDLSGSTVTSGD